MTARTIGRTLVLAGCIAALVLPAFAQARQAPAPKPDPQVEARYQLAIMADVLLACAPHAVDTPHKGRHRRAKLDFNVGRGVKAGVGGPGGFRPGRGAALAAAGAGGRSG